MDEVEELARKLAARDGYLLGYDVPRDIGLKRVWNKNRLRIIYESEAARTLADETGIRL